MCGRITVPSRLELTHSPFINRFSAHVPSTLGMEAIPGHKIPVIASNRVCGMMTWGFDKGSIYNTRSETYREKPFWAPYKDNHILIPIRRFYEGGRWFKNASYSIIYAAGIFREIDEHVFECSMLTKDSVGSIQTYHPRQPVTLKTEQARKWLANSMRVPA